MSSPYHSQISAPDDTGTPQPEIATGGDGRERIQEKMSDAAGSVADRAGDFAERQKQSGAKRVDDTATAVHRAADEIAAQSPLVGRYMHAGAMQLERASRLLRDNTPGELYRMANRLAHDRPLAFIGGSLAAGFVLARVLRSSEGASASAPREHLS